MSIRNLQFLFAPKSVAIVGASQRPGSVGATVYRNMLAGGFKGDIYPVNPKHSAFDGRRVFHSLAQLPRAPELAVICTPAPTVPGLIAQLGELGCRAAVVLSAGMDGAARHGGTLRQAMLNAAQPHLLRILGPNCVGLLVPGIGLNASFAPVNALPGRLAFVSQSGALVTGLLDWAAARKIGFSSFVSLGDGSDVDFGDLLDYLAADPGTDAILLYVESLRHARKFMSAARGAARGKPTLIVKAGRAAEAAHAAFSHTGALAGSDLVYDAAVRRAGMLRVYSTGELFDAAEMLSRRQPLRGERLAILTNGGGPGVMATDALIAGGGALAALAPETLTRLSAALPSNWSHGDPVDIIGDAPPERYEAALRALLAGKDSDALLLIHAPTAIAGSAAIARTLLPLLRAADRPVLTCWLGGASVAEARRLCQDAGVPAFDTPEAAVQAFLQQVRYRRNQNLLMQAPSAGGSGAPDREAARALVRAVLARGETAVAAPEAMAILAAYGIPVVGTATVATAGEAARAAARLGYPVALKLLSPDVTHKSDVGGVVLDIADERALREAAEAIGERLARLRPGARTAGFTVQAMARRPRAVELIVGVSTDPVFGPVVLFGQGGVAVEAAPDQAIALPPLNRVLAADLIDRTRVARLLAGYRDRPPADRAALCDVLVRIGQFAADTPELMELDINPLLADAGGVLALDARMRLAPAAPGARGADRLAILPYPEQLARTVHWEGQDLLVRPIRPEDGAAHQAFFAALTPEDVHFRMFGALRELTPAQLARFTQIDYAREMAFIATRTGAGGQAETLGVARVVADPDNIRGEFAVTVRSDLKGRGLGRLLLARLLEYCRAEGLCELRGTALPDNARMLALARELGFSVAAGDDAAEMRLLLHPDAGALV
ncbi:bifunctional acetate--CoA ligase family protein/GNAT family N-acetyltransferase [Pseudoduganella namucuonensis]|uniref:Acetyltransferase n=1 Tax=Pseudoduganella namucuonensis TaxID=1035707 RepID=A0A1I7KNU6_9BURK|nr:acetate--CoA ligase family protein [Pseudoduganella namucuonensis]SFU99044.1 acetyltransferase [Pseudoduganella namucuonensis]